MEETVEEERKHFQDLSPTRALERFPVLTLDLVVPLAGLLVAVSTVLEAVVWIAAPLSAGVLPLTPEDLNHQDSGPVSGEADAADVDSLASLVF